MGIPLYLCEAARSAPPPTPVRSDRGRSGWLTLGTTRQKKTRRPSPRPRRERLARKDDVAKNEPLKTDRQPSDRPPNTHARAEARCLPQGACDRRQRAGAVECRTAGVFGICEPPTGLRCRSPQKRPNLPRFTTRHPAVKPLKTRGCERFFSLNMPDSQV